jgi:hypothetical protein
VIACALMATIPLLWRGNSCGHDFDFHLQSWMEVTRQWHEGVWYPRWAASANYGAWEPRLLFYPPASWLLGGALGVILPWNAAPFVFVLLTLMGSGIACYAFAREWMTGEAAGVAAGLYVVNPYLLFVVYERGAYGELLAAVWIPLVMLFALRTRASLIPLSLTIAAVWLTNAPAAVMACYAVAVLAVSTAIQLKQWWPVLRAAGGSALGIGLAGFYIVPAAYERRWVEIERAIGPGMRVEDSFLFGHIGEAFHDQVLRTASWIAIAVLATAALAAWGVERRREERTVSRSLTGLLAIIAFLLMPFSQAAWRWAPELKFLQFPWRWLLVASAATAFLVGLAVHARSATANSKRNLLWIAAVLAFAALPTATAARVYWQACDDEDAVIAQVTVFRSGDGFEGTDEYAPRNADNSAIQQELPLVRVLARADGDTANSSVQQDPPWTSSLVQPAKVDVVDSTTEHKAFRVQTPTAGFAVLKLMDYPSWRVRVNGVDIVARPQRNDGLMTIPITAGGSAIDVKYERTPDVSWGLGLSVTSLLTLIGLAVKGKKWQRHRIS